MVRNRDKKNVVLFRSLKTARKIMLMEEGGGGGGTCVLVYSCIFLLAFVIFRPC